VPGVGVGIVRYTSILGMSKQVSYDKIYRPNVRGRRPDVRTRPRLHRGRVFIRGRVFTVRVDGKKRVRVDVPMRPRGHRRVCADATMRPCGHGRVRFTSPLPPRSPYADGLYKFLCISK
jgi:hypothetical protein